MTGNRLALPAVAAATAAPMLLPVSMPPSTTALNQLAACALWSAACLASGIARPADADRCAARRPRSLGLTYVALAVLFAGVLVSFRHGLAPSLGASACALVVACALCSWLGSTLPVLGATALARGLVIAGGASVLIAAIQVAAPACADGTWIARSTLPGRAVGNMRQPNHLASLLVLSAIATVALASRGRWPRRWAWTLFAGQMLGLVLSASRTGYIGVALLTAWGLVDRRLEPRWRWTLLSAPLVLGGWWLVFEQWATSASAPFAPSSRLHEADISGSRFGIWRNALELVSQQPWTGVGWGQFNLAWTLTPLPGRPTALFDHAHNLPLQLVVELGIPAGGLACALLITALGLAARQAWCATGQDAVMAHALFAMLVLAAVHSLLEYPLWYATFLLPIAFVFGACLGWPHSTGPTQPPELPNRLPSATGTAQTSVRADKPGLVMAATGVLALAASGFAIDDYLRVSAIFADPPHAQPLTQRIDAGRGSLFFAHQADYARATTAARPGDVMDSFDVAKYNLLDTRLMIAWARAFAERGDIERARYLAARLREFNNPTAKDFFAACESDGPRPFQCNPPAANLGWRDFAGRAYRN